MPDGFWPHTGAVLAGGGSRRMGRDKHSIAMPDGRTMLETVIATLGQVCGHVVVCGQVATDLPIVGDLRPDAGPAAGLEALLSSGLDSEYLLCPCDVPLITAAVLTLLTRRTSAAATVFLIAGETAFRPLPARLSTVALPKITTALDAGRHAVGEVLAELDLDIVELADDRPLFNVNRPEDAAALGL